MALKRLDQTKPPPGWRKEYDNTIKGTMVVRRERMLEDRGKSMIMHVHIMELPEAWGFELSCAQPYVNDALARLVEWLRGDGDDVLEIAGLGSEECVRALADAIESGEWRNG